MKRYLLLIAVVNFLSLNVSANEIKILNANNPTVCKNITGITGAFAEGLSDKYKFSVRSVSFLRSEISDSKGDVCWIIVDTPDGKRKCIAGGAVIGTKGKYLAHPFLKKEDAEGYRYFGGNCL
jgi:hypothetical protein